MERGRRVDDRPPAFGFSEDLVERFLRPWFAGVFLEPELETSSRFFDFTFRMFAVGDAALPEDGMQAIPRQLAEELDDSDIELKCPIEGIEASTILLHDGRRESFDAVVVATEAPAARRLLGSPLEVTTSRSTTCLHYAADRAPSTNRC